MLRTMPCPMVVVSPAWSAVATPLRRLSEAIRKCVFLAAILLALPLRCRFLYRMVLLTDAFMSSMGFSALLLRLARLMMRITIVHHLFRLAKRLA